MNLIVSKCLENKSEANFKRNRNNFTISNGRTAFYCNRVERDGNKILAFLQKSYKICMHFTLRYVILKMMRFS